MTPQSRKAKGRNLQKWIREKLITLLGVKEEDVQSRSMGAAGEDVILSLSARDIFPYAVEAKNQERVQLWAAYEQAIANTQPGLEPLLVVKRNLHRPLAVIDAEYFIALHKKNNNVIKSIN